MKKEDIFNENLKKAKDGNLYNYDNWLNENGIQPDRLNRDRFDKFFWSNAELMINNEREIEIIAKYIGSFLRDKLKSHHIPIIGVKGSGKTLIMNVIQKFISSSGIGCNYQRLYAPKLESNILKPFSMTEKKHDVLFIDQCNEAKEIIKIIKKIVESNGNGVYITFWSPESWNEYKLEIEELLPISQELYLLPIKKGEISIFIERIFRAVAMDGRGEKFYPDFVKSDELNNSKFIERIYNCTKGVPLLIIKLIVGYFEQTFLKKKNTLYMDVLQSTLNNLGLCSLSNYIDGLSTQHLRILETILLENSKQGARPIELVEKHNLDKSTISYHLNVLKDKGILKKEKIGKSSHYKIKKNLIPLIQLKIMGVFK